MALTITEVTASNGTFWEKWTDFLTTADEDLTVNVSSLSGVYGVRRVQSVAVAYAGAAPTHAGVTIRYVSASSGSNGEFDIDLDASAANAQAHTYVPTATVTLHGNDVLEVVAPWGAVAGTGQEITATIVEDTPGTLTEGDCTVLVEWTESAPGGGTLRQETLTVALAEDDTEAQVAGKIRTALGLNETITGNFTVSGADADVILTRDFPVADDDTMKLSYEDDTCVGLTAGESTTTTPGVTASVSSIEVVCQRL